MTSPGDFVSTGVLPPGDRVHELVVDTWRRYRDQGAGATSAVYPILAEQSPDLFGISMVSISGDRWEVGDAEHEFPVMSVAKPFLFALVCSVLGGDECLRRIGVDATGTAFDSVATFDRHGAVTTNPMVNVGAVLTTSMVPGDTAEAKWRFVRDGLSGFAGRPLQEMPGVLSSARASNHRNRAIARLLDGLVRLDDTPDTVTDLYTRMCCLGVTARDLAMMGATLADAGVQPVTGARVVSQLAARQTLAVMATAGLYETSGTWLFTVGLPAKSGIGGGIVTAAPGKGGLGTFSPLLDAAGNSVRGQLAAAMLSRGLGLDLFVSDAVDEQAR